LSDPSGPESSIDGLERALWLFKKGNKAGCPSVRQEGEAHGRRKENEDPEYLKP